MLPCASMINLSNDDLFDPLLTETSVKHEMSPKMIWRDPPSFCVHDVRSPTNSIHHSSFDHVLASVSFLPIENSIHPIYNADIDHERRGVENAYDVEGIDNQRFESLPMLSAIDKQEGPHDAHYQNRIICNHRSTVANHVTTPHTDDNRNNNNTETRKLMNDDDIYNMYQHMHATRMNNEVINIHEDMMLNELEMNEPAKLSPLEAFHPIPLTHESHLSSKHYRQTRASPSSTLMRPVDISISHGPSSQAMSGRHECNVHSFINCDNSRFIDELDWQQNEQERIDDISSLPVPHYSYAQYYQIQPDYLASENRRGMSYHCYHHAMYHSHEHSNNGIESFIPPLSSYQTSRAGVQEYSFLEIQHDPHDIFEHLQETPNSNVDVFRQQTASLYSHDSSSSGSKKRRDSSKQDEYVIPAVPAKNEIATILIHPKSFEMHPSQGEENNLKPPNALTKLYQQAEKYKGITDHDVLLGKGNYCYRHIGNILYRSMIKECQTLYASLDSKNGKTEIAKGIVEKIYANGGRFMIQKPTTLEWKPLRDEAARKKVSQALREKRV